MVRHSKADLDTISRAKSKIDDWFSYYSHNNANYHLDFSFAYGDENEQWTDEQKKEYDDLTKPLFSFNMLPKYLNNIEGEYALNTPDLKVRPIADTEYNEEKIGLIDSLLRYISLNSRANIVKQTALGCALSGGYGAIRVITCAESMYSFNEEIKYKAVTDPTKCFWDPAAIEHDKSDGNICGILKSMTNAEFKSKYPNIKLPESFVVNDNSVQWFGEDNVTVADFYEKKYFTKKIYLLSDESGNQTQIVDDDELDEVTALNPELKITDQKKINDYVIKFYRITGNHLLEKSTWNGKELPLIFQAGILKYINGKEYTYSFIRYVKDSQRAYNWSRSEHIYRLMLARYEPFIGPEESVEGHEEEWKQAYKAKSYLPYKTLPSGERPQRVSSSEPPQSLILEMQQAHKDIQDVLGRYEANVGAAGNEISGIAIANRQRPSNMSVMPFFTNATRAFESVAKATLDLIPKIYDTERQLILTDKNNSTKPVTLNAENGYKNDVTTGQYDVSVTVGPSFAMQQAQSVESLLKIVQSFPQFAQISPDILAENLDIRGQERLVNRTQKYLIPDIIAEEKGEKVAPKPPNQQEIMIQQQMQLEKMASQIELMRATSDKTYKHAQSVATLMNAQTNQQEAQLKGVETSQKVEVEEKKAQIELLEKELTATKGDI